MNNDLCYAFLLFNFQMKISLADYRDYENI